MEERLLRRLEQSHQPPSRILENSPRHSTLAGSSAKPSQLTKSTEKPDHSQTHNPHGKEARKKTKIMKEDSSYGLAALSDHRLQYQYPGKHINQQAPTIQRTTELRATGVNQPTTTSRHAPPPPPRSHDPRKDLSPTPTPMDPHPRSPPLPNPKAPVEDNRPQRQTVIKHN